MKALYIFIALVVLGGGYFIYSQRAEAPAASEMGMTEEGYADMDEHDNGETHDETADMAMPAPGNEDVEEMIADKGGDGEVDAVKTFEIGGTNFAFDVTEMKVKEGDTVTVNFVSNDGFHDWVVDEFGAQTERVQTGGTTSVTFVAERAGTYEYYCSVGQHRANGMVGTLIVE